LPSILTSKSVAACLQKNEIVKFVKPSRFSGKSLYNQQSFGEIMRQIIGSHLFEWHEKIDTVYALF
jgi:hypothetical protein